MLQVSNKLHGCRFKLQESAKKLQECMNGLEKEHAWQDHTAQLTGLLELHATAIQVTLHKHPYTESQAWYGMPHCFLPQKSVVSNHETFVQCAVASYFQAPAPTAVIVSCSSSRRHQNMHHYNICPLQDAKSWLETSAATGTTFDADLRPVTPGNQDATPWGEAKADAAWDSPEQLQLEDGEQYEANDILSIAAPDDFQVVGSKKKKSGRQQNAPGNTSGRGRRQGKR